MTTVTAPRDGSATDFGVLARLSVMMFLQYFVQGCYLPIAALYLKNALEFSPGEIGTFFAALSIGPLISPLLLGQLVDRRFATERVLAVSHLAAAAMMFALYTQEAAVPVIVLGTLYSILYVPTMMLTNALAFHHLVNREREFPLIRMWGTIGFILPAWLIEPVFLRGLEDEALNAARGIALVASAVAGVLMAVYCLTLPHTPPAKREERDFAPLLAARLVRQRRFLVLVVVTFVIAMVHNYHFALNSPFLNDVLLAGGVTTAWEQRISSLGQIAEIGVMIVLGLLIRQFGFKRTMLIGITAYMTRCLLFAVADRLQLPFAATMTIVCVGQALHGLCFGCFLAVAFIYLDRTTPHDLRGSVQSLYGTFVFASGNLVGGLFSGWVAEWFTEGTGTAMIRDWAAIWLTGAALAAGCLVAFGALFPRDQYDRAGDIAPAP